MAGWTQDFKFALRMLAKRPVVTAVAALSLGFGIAAHSGTFAVAKGFLIEPFRWFEPDRVVLVNDRQRVNPSEDGLQPIAPAAFHVYRESSRSFEALEAYTTAPANLTGDGEPVRVNVVEMTPGLLGVLGRPLVAGAGFSPTAGRGGSSTEVVLTHGIASTRFGSAAAALDRSLLLDGRCRSTPAERVLDLFHESFAEWVGPRGTQFIKLLQQFLLFS